MNIPKTIMQTYSSKENLTPEMYNNIASWKKTNPDWNYEIFYDEDCRYFLKENFNTNVLEAFNKINSGAGKADLFRYCYLYIKGGVYVDMDNIPLVPLNSLIQETDEFLSVLSLLYRGVYSQYNGKSFAIHQSFIVSEPKHKFLDMAIKLCTYNIINRVRFGGHEHPAQQTHQLIRITGPKLLADAINMVLGKKINSTFNIRDIHFPFRFIKGNGDVIKNDKGEIQKGQFTSSIKDKNGRTIMNCKYNGYNPGDYWAHVNLYNQIKKPKL